MTLVLLGHSYDRLFGLLPDSSSCVVANLVYDEILYVTRSHVPCPLRRLNSEPSIINRKVGCMQAEAKP